MSKGNADDMTHENFTPQELGEMEDFVAEFFRKNNIKITYPVDSIALAKDMGFKVFASSLSDIGENADGLIAVNENEDKILGVNSNKIIFYDRSISSSEDIRFVIAHELAHYMTEKEKGNKVVFAEKVKIHGEKKSKDEQKMDYIAAAILVPKNILSIVLQSLNFKDCDESIKPLFISSLASSFKVSSSVMKRRIEEIS